MWYLYTQKDRQTDGQTLCLYPLQIKIHFYPWHSLWQWLDSLINRRHVSGPHRAQCIGQQEGNGHQTMEPYLASLHAHSIILTSIYLLDTVSTQSQISLTVTSNLTFLINLCTNCNSFTIRSSINPFTTFKSNLKPLNLPTFWSQYYNNGVY